VRSDFRLITATNVELSAAVRRVAFRDDLFHRLKVVQLHLPPLRERREDIALLVSHFITGKRQRLRRAVCRVTHAALDQLCSYDWSGNVRELENVVETAILDCDNDSIEPGHLRFEGGAVPRGLPTEDLDVTFREARQHAMQAFERLYLLGQLRRFRGRITDVARHAGVTTNEARARADAAPRHRPPRLPATAAALGGAALVARVGRAAGRRSAARCGSST
jgi:DNA-binding NtrC family response regulator